MRAKGWGRVGVAGLFCLGLLGAPWAAGQTPTVLHSFTGTASDGEGPYDSLLAVGSTLYGMTSAGGAGSGTLFSIRTSGKGFQVLHSFLDNASDGGVPAGSLILIGDRLYGMTTAGGGDGVNYWGFGTIFSIQTNGAGFTVLHSFSGLDGAMPSGSLVYWNKRLYGLAMAGGWNGGGALFSLRTDGLDFSVHHDFDPLLVDTDGVMPVGSLTLAGSRFFGTTWAGGHCGIGTLFSIRTDMAGFRVEHSFAGQAGSDGEAPRDSLTLVGNRLFGTTSLGGRWNNGTIFSIKTDGKGYDIHHEFPLADRTFEPDGNLVVKSGRLHGFAPAGRSSLFSLKTDGTDFQIHHVFAAREGTLLMGSPTIAGGKLYGMALQGGKDDLGTVFGMDVPVADVFVDNRDPHTLRYGGWSTSHSSQSWAADSRVSKSGSRSQFFWLPPPLVKGYYRVYAWWTASSSRPTSVAYYVRHADDVAIRHVNQKVNGGRWNSLGIYRFLPSRQAYVYIRADKRPTSADAIRFEYVGPNRP
jgi:uncharacterized repeat protein (TIGR03803 family)